MKRATLIAALLLIAARPARALPDNPNAGDGVPIRQPIPKEVQAAPKNDEKIWMSYCSPRTRKESLREKD